MLIHNVFPLSAGSQISAASLGVHIEISASPLISITTLNVALIRIVTIFYYILHRTSVQTIK